MVQKSDAIQRPVWANETRLGKYQHAEEVLNETGIFYLVRSTYTEVDTLWGTNFSCVSMRHDIEDNSTTYFSFKNSSESPKFYTLNMSTTLTTTFGYNRSNAIQYQLPNCSLVNNTIIFTSKECTLMSVEYGNENTDYNDAKGCELWASEEHLKNDTVPVCCYFLFDMLCAQQGTYDLYEKEKCKSDSVVPVAL
ncbi:male-specific histamine-binding salivary protein-like [Dermacentor andersoni]|uniref:male-specific histamine-binding salivary protein-like n=1 Tax=Dermacentor andersoni TaxID=34620 RepID=UPI002417A00D|nr:female-specific histamine-binding protein 2-like [Dermacentor andersoni]